MPLSRRSYSLPCILVLLLGLMSIIPARAVAAGPPLASAYGSDPRGDAYPAGDPRGDITSLWASDNGSAIVVSVTTASFDDPYSSYNWKAYPLGDKRWDDWTAIWFTFDTNHNNEDYQADLYNNGKVVHAAVFNNKTTKQVCWGQPDWDARLSMYRIIFATSCDADPGGVLTVACA